MQTKINSNINFRKGYSVLEGIKKPPNTYKQLGGEEMLIKLNIVLNILLGFINLLVALQDIPKIFM